MQRFLVSLALACVFARPAWAQVEAPPVVPVAKASYHVPVFRNEYVTLLNVYIPPSRTSGYHRHASDSIGVLLGDAERTAQTLGGKPATAARRERGSVSFSFYSQKENVHAVTNTGTTPFHNLVIELVHPAAGRHTASARSEAPGYVQVMDNPRARGWRLVLAPGESAPAVIQTAPGFRIVVDGGEIVESVPGQPERGIGLRSGEFYWQDAGTTRSVRNNGVTRVEVLEFELK